MTGNTGKCRTFLSYTHPTLPQECLKILLGILLGLNKNNKNTLETVLALLLEGTRRAIERTYFAQPFCMGYMRINKNNKNTLEAVLALLRRSDEDAGAWTAGSELPQSPLQRFVPLRSEGCLQSKNTGRCAP